jgi:hypothetical protein
MKEKLSGRKWENCDREKMAIDWDVYVKGVNLWVGPQYCK